MAKKLHNLFVISIFLISFVFCSASLSITSKRQLRNVPVGYCVANDIASDDDLQAAIDYVCGRGVDCGIISGGGVCFIPNNRNFHASVVVNAYYKAHNSQGFYCSGDGPLVSVGQLVFSDPSQGSCKFVS